MTRPIVLVPGNTHPHGFSRLKQHFDVRHVGAPIELSEDMSGSVTGLATFMHPVTCELIDRLPALQVISSFGVGYDHVDAAHAATKNIMVTHTPSVLDDEVADTTIGLLLNTLRELPRAEQWLRDGKWQLTGAYRLTPLTLRNRTVGIFGMGRIGQAIAERLTGFGVAIHYHNRKPVDGSQYSYHGSLISLAGAVDTLISVVPATQHTDLAITADVLVALGPTGVFINVGRGNVVDEAVLAQALSDGTIAAAGLDVFTDEPNVPQSLLALENVTLLPHVASASVHTRNAMADLVVDNLTSWYETGVAITPVPECQ